mgnify:CR=1 FL=1
MSPLLVGGIVEAVGKIADDLFTSDKERLDAEIELRKVDAGLLQGQMEINKVEAAHASVFVAGWRPAIGWIGAAALGYQFLLDPALIWAWAFMQAKGWVPTALQPPPVLDAEALWALLAGMLGIAGMRTYEKTAGVARN